LGPGQDHLGIIRGWYTQTRFSGVILLASAWSPDCSQFCSCRFPPASTGIHRFQRGSRISLKRKHLKTGDFGRRPETALGSVDPPCLFLFVFNHLQNNPVEP
jgi:hypothetical protein